MKIKLSKNGVIAAVSIIAIAGATNAGQYYLWDKHKEELTLDYEDQIYLMQQTLDEIGPLTDVYTVLEKGQAGQAIIQEDLALIQMPMSMVGESYILDPETVVGKFYKVNISHGVPITSDLLMETAMDDTTREYDLVADVWPVALKTGDYIDLEIIYPNGEKFVVLGKKRVDSIVGQTIKTTLNGTERYLYQGALVDYYLSMSEGAQIRFTKYVEPGVQKTAQVYYSIPDNIVTVMNIDPNVVEKANSAIETARRSIIQSSMEFLAENRTAEEPLVWNSGIQSVQAKLAEAYQEYLANYGLNQGTVEEDWNNEAPVEDFLNEQIEDVETVEVEEGVAE